MEFRLAKRTDKSALLKFLTRNTDKAYKNLAQADVTCAFSRNDRRPTFILAVEDRKIIGTVAFSEELFSADIWGVSWVHVDQKYRRQGVGQHLVEHCLTQIGHQANKTVTVILNTYPGKTGLYDRLKFKKMGQDHTGGFFMAKILPITNDVKKRHAC